LETPSDFLPGLVGAGQREHKAVRAGQVKEGAGGTSPAVDTDSVMRWIVAEIVWPFP